MYRDFGVNPVNLTKPRRDMTIAQALVITLLAICAATSEAVRLPLRIPTKAAFDSEIALVSRGS